MTIIVVVTTILTLLALLAVPKVNAQTPVHFDYPLFDENSGNSLIVLNSASIDSSDRVLKLRDSTDKGCGEICPGQILYSNGIEFIGRNLEKTSSFSSSFVFSMTARSKSLPSDGFLFFLTATNPNDFPRTSWDTYYGVFPIKGQTKKPTIAVEFDTLENVEVNDIDDNHVGVDLSQAESASQESCNSQNISLLSGDKIKTWIEYHDPVKTLEIRLAYWDPDVVRPAYPLLNTSLDLTTLVEPLMYVGFASRDSYTHIQKCAIYSWSFHSQLESRALSKRSKIIVGLCVGGGLAVIVALAAWFCLRPYCHKKAQKDRRKQPEATNTDEILRGLAGRELIPLSEREIWVDFPVPASPQGDSGYGRGDDMGSGVSNIIVYQDPSSPSSFSVESTAKPWIVWSTGAGPSFGRTGALSPVGIQRTMFWVSLVRSPRRALPQAGNTIIYTNTLYDSSPEEYRVNQPRQRPLFPCSYERSTRARQWVGSQLP